MQLDRIIIHNFRSIKDITISFDKTCLILLGKNEAGKSNILKAIAAVFGAYKVSEKDKRKKINNEKIDDYSVKAVFKLSQEVIHQVADIYSKTTSVFFGNSVSLIDFVNDVFNEFIVTISVGNSQKPSFSYWEYDETKYVITEGPDLKTVTKGVFDIITKQYSLHPFRCHYWHYSDSYLLPPSVDIQGFINSPDTFKGLKNLFILCDREDIKKEFESSLSQDGDYMNLLSQVSESVTSTFRKIWKDFKGTSIELNQNGGEILIKVKDKVRYSFEDRSDGFKRFVSILLMLSAPSRKNKLSNNDIILIDEPDNSLYPTSARYLRDELLRIGEKSFVIYATHSQYMIDSDCIERHLIVEKKDDITSIRKQEGHAPYNEDELLRNAIGTSIFECIRSNNLVFEGWLDKKLFEIYTDADKKRKATFKDYGKVYLTGITGAMTLCNLLMLAEKSFVVVADSDDTSATKKKDFCKAYPDYTDNWKGYSDVVGGISTVEDFLKAEYLEKYLREHYKADFTYNTAKNAIQNIESVIKDKDKKQEIKAALITNANKDDIKSEYGDYLDAISDV